MAALRPTMISQAAASRGGLSAASCAGSEARVLERLFGQVEVAK